MEKKIISLSWFQPVALPQAKIHAKWAWTNNVISVIANDLIKWL